MMQDFAMFLKIYCRMICKNVFSPSNEASSDSNGNLRILYTSEQMKAPKRAVIAKDPIFVVTIVCFT